MLPADITFHDVSRAEYVCYKFSLSTVVVQNFMNDKQQQFLSFGILLSGIKTHCKIPDAPVGTAQNVQEWQSWISVAGLFVCMGWCDIKRFGFYCIYPCKQEWDDCDTVDASWVNAYPIATLRTHNLKSDYLWCLFQDTTVCSVTMYNYNTEGLDFVSFDWASSFLFTRATTE